MRLRDRTVSARHCAIRCAGGRLAVRDLESRNGTFVGGARVPMAELMHGACVLVGRVAITVRRARSAPAEPTCPPLPRLVGHSPVMLDIAARVRRLAPLSVPVALLTGRQTGRARQSILEGIREGHAPIVIGTHALFQEGVQFANLALAIIDEQHRFGVHQRLALREKGAAGGRQPHQLIMTATPIPRTLAMTAYADLDVSVIDELPPGRTPVKTVALPETRRVEVVQRIRSACLADRQAYWVCPLIDESEEMPYSAAEETAQTLAQALPELRVGLVHGRMPGAAKERTMQEFKQGVIQLLVATTVIEVGVDVPNASLMIIENAERMGLAQLHQLRGRVGRGTHESTCVLLYQSPMSQLGRERLAVMRNTNDGFEVARRDLELRGPGELLGTRQTGLSQMRVADLSRDADLLPAVQRAAQLLLARWPDHVAPLIARWIGQAEQYGRVG